MKAVVCGDFSQPWHTETHVARDLGHHAEVETVDRSALDTLEGRCGGADLLLIQGGGWPPRLPELFRRIEQHGCVTASYHLDLFAGLQRSRTLDTEPMWRTQHVFTADGDPDSQAWFAARGVNHHWLPAAVVSDETGGGNWRDEYDHDVVFVGARAYHTEHPWRRQLLRLLGKTYACRFRLFDHHPPTRGADLNDLYATARVVVGDTLALPGHRNYTSDRLFETIGRGGALVYPRVEGIEDPLGFREHEHLRFYDIGDEDGLVRTIDDMLADPTETRAMAERGSRFVVDNHTYAHRMQVLLDVIG